MRCLPVNYIGTDGEFERENLARDVKNGKLTREQIITLCKNPDVKKEFFGKFKADKPKDQWNVDYLDNIYFRVVGEVFNEEYLLYLWEIAEDRKKNKRKYK